MAAIKTLIGNVKGPQGEKGEKGDTGPAGSTGIRGSRWAEGTAITGTSTEGAIFPDTGITDALVGDMYLNTSTGNVYRCTESGAASAARWAHTGNLKGPTGERGASGEAGPKGDTGIRGSRIYQGTAVTGTSSTSEIFSGSGIPDAMVDDVYINTADGNTYKCTVPGPAETARWAYTGCIRGSAGEAPEAADDMTVGFSASSERTNINTGEKMSTLMGKIKKWFADMTVAAFAQVISSNTDLMANTLPGYLVDALAVRQQFEAVNSNLNVNIDLDRSVLLGSGILNNFAVKNNNTVHISIGTYNGVDAMPLNTMLKIGTIASDLPNIYRVKFPVYSMNGNGTSIFESGIGIIQDGKIYIYLHTAPLWTLEFNITYCTK